jgi:hypothetical protein
MAVRAVMRVSRPAIFFFTAKIWRVFHRRRRAWREARHDVGEIARTPRKRRTPSRLSPPNIEKIDLFAPCGSTIDGPK